ncbi:Protein of unknown function [Gryllus bimaculatus]|nr:Protein of unknown function [Gryllus bimaculatus]
MDSRCRARWMVLDPHTCVSLKAAFVSRFLPRRRAPDTRPSFNSFDPAGRPTRSPALSPGWEALGSELVAEPDLMGFWRPVCYFAGFVVSRRVKTEIDKKAFLIKKCVVLTRKTHWSFSYTFPYMH